MENLIILTRCGDDSCLSPRSSAALISVICLFGSFLEVALTPSSEVNCGMKEHLNTLKNILVTLFEMANVLLLLGSVVENPLLLQIYLWYNLGFIIIDFALVILDFCYRTQDEGIWSLVTFVPEVVFLFVLFRCLSLVDGYKKRLEVV